MTSRISPVPGRPPKLGKKFGGNFRNYSHAAEHGEEEVDYINTTKAETAKMVAWILAAGSCGPWGVAIATSGQKHVIPHAPINGAGDVCMVAFEDQVLRVSRATFGALNSRMNGLRSSSGCSVSALMTGEYHPKDLARDMAGVREFETTFGHLRGGGLFELAAFLTSKGGA